MKKPDILIFISDQHNALNIGYAGDNIIKTPNLHQLATDGTVFYNAYTSCQLCVPARASMLTGQLPSKTSIFTNDAAIGVDKATFLHVIAAEGYETVLCGRMHFMGEDQRHGFTKRIMDEITPLYWGRGGAKREDLGPYVETLTPVRCTDVVGGGNSPVLEYDKQVIEAAIKYLSKQHDKPQCLVIGTYAPHFSYVAPEEHYEKYLKVINLPATLDNPISYGQPYAAYKEKILDHNTIRKIRAAYYGMITNLDWQIGEVRKAWKDYLHNQHREGLFIYLSDHGDQIGERNLYGKETFYEGSSKIPLLFEGYQVKQNNEINGPVSIMDLGVTLCDILGCEGPPNHDGLSLKAALNGEDGGERYVISEFMEEDPMNNIVYGRMIRQGKWKLITYVDHEDNDLLFDLEKDPQELNNVISDNSIIARKLKNILEENWEKELIMDRFIERAKNHHILSKWGNAVNVLENERWIVTEKAKELPVLI